MYRLTSISKQLTRLQHTNKWLMKKSKSDIENIRKIYTMNNYTQTNKMKEDVDKLKNKKIITEDVGKIFEMAICLTYNTLFDGNYKYSMDEAIKIKENILQKLPCVFPYKLKHIAKKGNKYDFVCLENDIYLSAKTTKKDGKVCPQVIGQPSKNKFCEFFSIDSSFTLEQIKEYIQINVKTLLDVYFSNTFLCPIVYYNKHKK